jgi:hypothetical protein
LSGSLSAPSPLGGGTEEETHLQPVLSEFFFGPLALVVVLLPFRINPAVSAKWSYLVLAGVVGVVVWLMWNALYAN